MPSRILLVIFAALTGCVSVYQGSQVESHLDQLNSQIQQSSNSVKGAMGPRENLLRSLLGSGVDKSQAPYPELFKKYGEMKKLSGELDRIQTQIAAEAAQLKQAVKGKNRISQDEPEFKRINEFKDHGKDAAEKYGDIAKDLQKRMQEFDGILQRERIGEVNVTELKGKVESSLRQADEQVGRLKTIMKDPRVPPAAQPTVSKETGFIEGKLDEIRSLEMAFLKEAGDKTKLVVGPQMVSHSIMTQMKTKADEIGAAGQRIQDAITKN